ncbi:fungal-specific transcription factor domain-containing protein [Dactylonectria estremocensis]|uniref:Fungal-specific transcription factor domain-containing protein n=1 Tax=Dactylonectria estremocensis TaxID=1079267 RepID=A0A9P9E871_9HYPO|nr:fungal-specific transcription factor domain-containing protein [Dactylonectria estremocensis]
MASLSSKARSTASCDNCRTRKLKCIRQDHAACQRCLHAGTQCVTNRKRLSRPYYQTTKEQFGLMASIVHHFLPDVSLDKDELRHAVLRLENQATPSLTNDEGEPPAPDLQDAAPRPEDAAAMSVRPPMVAMSQHSPGHPQPENPHPLALPQDCPQAQPVAVDRTADAAFAGGHPLQDDDGCLDVPSVGGTLDQRPNEGGQGGPLSPPPTSTPSSVADSGSLMLRDATRVPRYYNKSSYTTFFSIIHSSIRSSTHSRLFDTQPSIDDYPLDGQSTPSIAPADLPSLSLVTEAAQKFFTEMNSTIYVLNYARFQSQLQDLYVTGAAASNALLAIIHGIGFLGTSDPRLFADAVRYSNASVEEASLESVQAVMITVFGYMVKGQRNVAWISLGNAIRIAQSLGLHLHESLWEIDSNLSIDNRKRLWWSLFELDTMLSSTLGRPQSVDKDLVYTSIPQDSEFDQNAFTPPGYAKASAELALLHSEIVRDLYLRPCNGRDFDILAEQLMHRLLQWWDVLPLYLKPGCPTAPSYVRTIAFLGLRYYYIILLVTQPCLLQSTVDVRFVDDNFTRRVETCEEANHEAIIILKDLVTRNLISQMNFFDVFHILINGIILLLRCLKNQSPELIAELDQYIPLLSLADNFGIGKFGRQSMEALSTKLKNTSGSNDHDEAWPHFADMQPGQVLLDMFQAADFQWLDSPTLDVAHV